MKKLKNIHPGEILRREYLEPMGISQNMLAKRINVQPIRVNEIIHGKRGISPDTALRLDKFFGHSEGFWLGIQIDYDMREIKKKIAKTLLKIKPYNPGLKIEHCSTY